MENLFRLCIMHSSKKGNRRLHFRGTPPAYNSIYLDCHRKDTTIFLFTK